MLHQRYWHLFYELVLASSYCGQGSQTSQGKLVHHKSSQVQMGRQGNRLVRVLADSYRVETLVKEGQRNPEYEAPHERN